LRSHCWLKFSHNPSADPLAEIATSLMFQFLAGKALLPPIRIYLTRSLWRWVVKNYTDVFFCADVRPQAANRLSYKRWFSFFSRNGCAGGSLKQVLRCGVADAIPFDTAYLSTPTGIGQVYTEVRPHAALNPKP
jgi:hypothetical protein